jgi:class 3 adenylate cyclase/CheY-like chemotaxis protein
MADSSQSNPPQPPAQVLVVDDTPENRDLLGRRVRQQGHVVTEAENGKRAMEQLEQKPFDLVLLDIMMPELDGYGVLERMKADANLRHVPVIVISALGEMDSVVRCVALGAEDYLLKPFNAILLKARISASLEKKWLRDRERQVLSELKAEQERSERLLRSLFPEAIAERLKNQPPSAPVSIAESFAAATVLYADISNFTELSAGKPATEVVRILNVVFSAFDQLAGRHGLEKIKTIGDTYVLAAGVPHAKADHTEAAADVALLMQQEILRLSVGLPEPLSLRIGIDTGPVVAGVIGTTKFAYDIWGKPVDTAAQMEAFGVSGGIQVSKAVYRKLSASYLFEERGAFYVEGIGEVETWLLTGRKPGRKE